MITIIAAIGKNGELGKDNDLIWHLPNDLQRFKKITAGHHIIIGRKTFESLGKPLPNRTTIIITRNPDYKIDNCIVVNSLDRSRACLEVIACPGFKPVIQKPLQSTIVGELSCQSSLLLFLLDVFPDRNACRELQCFIPRLGGGQRSVAANAIAKPLARRVSIREIVSHRTRGLNTQQEALQLRVDDLVRLSSRGKLVDHPCRQLRSHLPVSPQ